MHISIGSMWRQMHRALVSLRYSIFGTERASASLLGIFEKRGDFLEGYRYVTVRVHSDIVSQDAFCLHRDIITCVVVNMSVEIVCPAIEPVPFGERVMHEAEQLAVDF